MPEHQDLTLTLHPDGVAVASMNMAGRAFNVFSEAMIDALEAVIAHAEQEPKVQALVFASTKDSFMAGADLAMVREFATMRLSHTPEQIRRRFSRLGRLMRRLERLPKPTVAALNGLALGGGLELALACRCRILVDRPQARLGLPEVKLGLLPGAGGTQRLPRLIGAEAAARLLLGGEPVGAQEAKALGLVQVLLPDPHPELALEAAHRAALRSPPPSPWCDDDWRAPLPDVLRLPRAEATRRLLALGGRNAAEHRNYPALGAIVDCVLDGLPLAIDAGIEVEERCFLRLMLDPVAGNMIRTSFLNRTAATKRAAERAGGRAEGAALRPAPGDRLLVMGEAVVIAASAETARRGVGLAEQLKLCPVLVDPAREGLLQPCLAAARDWARQQQAAGISPQRLAAAAAAVDAAPLARACGLPDAGELDLEADRAPGLALLAAVAETARQVLAAGGVATADDADLLGVFGLGFPAWTGGPIAFLEQHR